VENDTADKYIAMIAATVEECVVATNQTYVEALKKEGKFDAEAQKAAFEKTLAAVLSILSDDAKDYIVNVTGDLSVYLTNLIEASVSRNK
jgi:CMP-2-keto-3-deoxyoctulosonic acid synthetase